MRLIDFKLRAPRGTYYGARPTPETIAAMQEFLKQYDIPNPIPLDAMHCTVVYSRVFCGEPALGDLDPHWDGQFDQYNVWETNPKEEEEAANCLTLGFNCHEMHKRHHHLRTRGATHDFPDFKPHMTMSYDVGPGYDIRKLPKYQGPIKFYHEYTEPLNLDYVKTKLNK